MTPSVTRLAFDGHVHLYPAYDWARALRSLFLNLGREGTRLGLLAESAGCSFYRQVLDRPTAFSRDGLSVTPGPGAGALSVTDAGSLLGVLIAGRQVVAAERLEVLALGTDDAVADGQPVDRVLAIVRERGGVPVLSWSPGKWFGERGRRVAHLIAASPPGSFLVGDTGLRPTCWSEPRLMRLARARGIRVIAGSDALPLAGEERWLGTYGVTAAAPFDPLAPADSVRRMLAYGNVILTPAGRRAAPLPFARRWLAHYRRQKAAAGTAARAS